MRTLAAVPVLALALTCLPISTTAHASSIGGVETWDDGDQASADLVLDPATTGADEVVESSPIALELQLSRCTAANNVTKHATITYTDAAGQPTFAWHHDITYSYNCKVVTRITHTSSAVIFQPQYTFHGYIVNSVSPAGQKKATASAQGRFGICESVVGDVCALERDPSIVWHVDSAGKAYATSTT